MDRQRCRTAVRGRSRTRALRGVVTPVRPNPDWQQERSRPKSRCFSRLLVVRHFTRAEGEIWGGDRAPPNTPELGYRNPVVSSCFPEFVQKLESAAELQLELPGSPGSSPSGSPSSFRSVSPPSSPESPLRSLPPAPPSGPLRPLPTPPRCPPFIPAMPLEPPLLPGAVPLPLPPPKRRCVFLKSLRCVSVETEDQDEPMEAAETAIVISSAKVCFIHALFK
ncbi:proline-, glutamic acid- and leucine-rich protein 1-like [Lepisosteus oculatus]|uniref:proline-, glutamic acid- and leucine-rich protein 1-like n=1 Tax=Lepisosteus oculatus TaxID=7918 RepID=UPI0035F502DB